MTKQARDLTAIAGISIASILVVWLPFIVHMPSVWGINLHRSGLEMIKRNYDGLNYIVIAKSFYDPSVIISITHDLPPTYFAAHFPLYPLTIRLVGLVSNNVNATLVLAIATTISAAIAFYFLLKEIDCKQNKVWLTTCFLVLPARWLVVHSVP